MCPMFFFNCRRIENDRLCLCFCKTFWRVTHFQLPRKLSSSAAWRLKITYSRSGGPGGQHVNKVNSKAAVRFHVQTAEWIPEEVRNEILLKNKTRINKAGELIVTSEVSRSQHKNLEDCLHKISEMITEASQRPTEPSADDVALRTQRLKKRNLQRLKEKKIHSATKRARQADFD
uniref:Large ribosomal subunit protein mL62 n=1 Tax=Electrophorus electricus TaxID=8005 RepID=A0A4W4ETM0_ELEEL